MWVVLNWFGSSRNEWEYPGTVGTEHVEIAGGKVAGLGGNGNIEAPSALNMWRFQGECCWFGRQWEY